MSSSSYPTAFHILAHLSKLAAMLEQGDRANPQRFKDRVDIRANPPLPLPPAVHYTDRAMDLWDAAKSTLVRRGIDIPQDQLRDIGDRRELPHPGEALEQLEGHAYQERYGEPLGGG